MKRIRKRVYDLTINDLLEFPVWIFALDEEGEPGRDEATVRPWQEPPPFDPGEGLNVLRTDFWLADGTQAVGYLSAQVPGDLSEIGYIQPTIVTPRGQVWFWFGAAKPGPDKTRNAYETLGKSRSQVFPVRYESAVEITTGRVTGVIKGFLYYSSIRDRTVEMMT
jgi:hypothetical protein